MPVDPVEDARAVLRMIQDRVSSRDVDAMVDLFDDHAVLFDSAGQAVGPEMIRGYMAGIANAPYALGWAWEQVTVELATDDVLVFSTVGDIVLVHPEGEQRKPCRGTYLAIGTGGRWRLRHVHISAPASNLGVQPPSTRPTPA